MRGIDLTFPFDLGSQIILVVGYQLAPPTNNCGSIQRRALSIPFFGTSLKSKEMRARAAKSATSGGSTVSPDELQTMRIVAIRPIKDKNEDITIENHLRMTTEKQKGGGLRTEAKAVSKISAFEHEEEIPPPNSKRRDPKTKSESNTSRASLSQRSREYRGNQKRKGRKKTPISGLDSRASKQDGAKPRSKLHLKKVKSGNNSVYTSKYEELQQAANKYNDSWFTFGVPPPAPKQQTGTEGTLIKWLMPCKGDMVYSEEEDLSQSSSFEQSFSEDFGTEDEMEVVEYIDSRDDLPDLWGSSHPPNRRMKKSEHPREFNNRDCREEIRPKYNHGSRKPRKAIPEGRKRLTKEILDDLRLAESHGGHSKSDRNPNKSVPLGGTDHRFPKRESPCSDSDSEGSRSWFSSSSHEDAFQDHKANLAYSYESLDDESTSTSGISVDGGWESWW